MRIAIISDIHSNLEALTEAFEIIEEKKVDEIVCLGDIIGYGASPNECLNLIRQNCKQILLGNHESVIVNPDQINDFSPNAKIAAMWTYKHLTDENKSFIKNLPMEFKLEELLFVHSSPFEPEEWHYIVSGEDRNFNFKFYEENICFFGHTHFPGVYTENGKTENINRDEKYLINVGSVGQPRDHDPRLSFGIFDTEQWSYENIRTEYDVKTTSEKILSAGLPKYLAERLSVGR
ncbi:MAG: metallophosphoesterase family protein [Ignavibacteriales bacterium]|nr:metallophosphoesterase family protein [Ignavibacteriales bacterium]